MKYVRNLWNKFKESPTWVKGGVVGLFLFLLYLFFRKSGESYTPSPVETETPTTTVATVPQTQSDMNNADILSALASYQSDLAAQAAQNRAAASSFSYSTPSPWTQARDAVLVRSGAKYLDKVLSDILGTGASAGGAGAGGILSGIGAELKGGYITAEQAAALQAGQISGGVAAVPGVPVTSGLSGSVGIAESLPTFSEAAYEGVAGSFSSGAVGSAATSAEVGTAGAGASLLETIGIAGALVALVDWLGGKPLDPNLYAYDRLKESLTPYGMEKELPEEYDSSINWREWVASVFEPNYEHYRELYPKLPENPFMLVDDSNPLSVTPDQKVPFLKNLSSKMFVGGYSNDWYADPTYTTKRDISDSSSLPLTSVEDIKLRGGASTYVN